MLLHDFFKFYFEEISKNQIPNSPPTLFPTIIQKPIIKLDIRSIITPIPSIITQNTILSIFFQPSPNRVLKAPRISRIRNTLYAADPTIWIDDVAFFTG